MLSPVSNTPISPSMTTEAQAGKQQAVTGSASEAIREQRTQTNMQIMQASMEVSIRSGDESLALLYRTAIDSINEHLEPALGPGALQAAMEQDNSPDATAQRILSQSTGFYEAYAAQRPNDDPEEVLRDFVDIVRGGFEQGYNEAASILQGLGVMGEGSVVAEEIGKTFTLVQQGYDDFLSAKLEELNAGQEEPDAEIEA